MALGSILSGVGSVIGGLTSAFGASKQMDQSEAMQAQAGLNWEQYRKSLVQGPKYEMRGLKKAGINPLLRYGQHGSPLPSTAQGVSQAPVTNPLSGLAEGIGGAVSSAADAYSKFASGSKAIAELDQIAANVEKIEEDTKLSTAQRDTEFSKQQLMFADRILRYSQEHLNREQMQTLRVNRELIASQTAINAWREVSERVRAEVLEAGLPRALADERIFDSWFGVIARYLDVGGKAINPFADRMSSPAHLYGQ